MIQSSLSTNPFFSCIITLYTIVLLYFPSFFMQIFFSPVFFFTFNLLLYLLRLGASQRPALNLQQGEESESSSTKPIPEDLISVANQLNSTDFKDEYSGFAEPNSDNFKCSEDLDLDFVEWDVRAPLEVIYEANEGEEEGLNDDVLVEVRDTQVAIIERYASLSMYYPETDSDNSSSEMDFQVTGELSSLENVGFRWDDEDVQGLIEIELEGKITKNELEENLIEIDLSPTR